jgi:hypothetical protein
VKGGTEGETGKPTKKDVEKSEKHTLASLLLANLLHYDKP